MINLSHSDYPDSSLQKIEDIDTGFKYARSSLGLRGLHNAFNAGIYKVRTTDFNLIQDENALHT